MESNDSLFQNRHDIINQHPAKIYLDQNNFFVVEDNMASKQINLFGKSTPQGANQNEKFILENKLRNVRGMYDKLKAYNGQKYSGMQVGGIHKWNYDNGIWIEKKLTPDKWHVNYQCIKKRFHQAPLNTGAGIGSGYHWYIIADQKAMKLDSNHYQTTMDGFKFKVGHKRPNWKNWSYEYPKNEAYKQRIIKILENLLDELKNG